MIRVTVAPEPERFDARVRKPGVLALHERVGRPPPIPRTAGRPCERIESIESFEDLSPEHFPPYWTEALDDLMSAYRRVCAYCCFAIHPITGARSVDHMIPKSERWDRVYEWGNYRLSAGRLNARKNDYQEVIDPFEVGDDWFEMEFVAFQLRPPGHLPAAIRECVQTTITRLGLNDHMMCSARESDYTDYDTGEISFAVLTRESPLVAREVIRTGRLRPEDAPTPAR